MVNDTVPARPGRVSAGLALILALAAVLLSGYLWYLLLYQRQDLLAIDVPSALARLETSVAEIERTRATSEERLKALTDTQDVLRSAVEKIQTEFGRGRVNWILGETEQLLLIGNRRLHLARDVPVALAALRAADRQLELLANPNLLDVRRELARELATLEAIEQLDISGMAIRIATLAESVDRLPLSSELSRATVAANSRATPGVVSDIGRDVWQDVLGLVHIRRYDAKEPLLLPPEQQYFLRENLRLMLYSAQHALLQGRIETYRRNLATADQWLRERFDGGDQAVRASREEIERLHQARVMTDPPNISGSLTLLRRITGKGPVS